ncbi:MAG: hypothetical protein HY744_13300 [Deltaproteobacteria bacterium]|nr:hypothetical protein [Deltaproteobacteria bacterium]
MNALGVALATDSALTIGGHAGTKIYNSADKLFLLSETAPVAAMLCGGTAIQDAPWEMLIKEYRQQNVRALRTVRDFARDFLAFVERRSALFPPEVQEAAVLRHVGLAVGALRASVERKLRQYMDEHGQLSESEARRLLARLLGSEIEQLRRDNRRGKLLARPLGTAALRRRYRPAVLRALREALANTPLGRAGYEQLADLVFDRLRRAVFMPDATGLVMAGFGVAEHFPSMVELVVGDVVAGKLRWAERGRDAISHSKAAIIRPFAQSEMVYSFMEGIDPRLEELTKQVVAGLVAELANKAVTQLPGLSKQRMSTMVRRMRQYVQGALPPLWDVLERFRHEEFSAPVTSMVAFLPKSELGAMAEALVNLTSFRRRVAAEEETVGGPIDVAVITKGDGFVWVRRKHYFEPDLNPRQIARHYRV